MTKMKEINFVGIGSSFNLNHLYKFDHPTFLVSFWDPLRIDNNGKIFLACVLSIIDLATCYHGMGHIMVLGLDKKNNTFFIRRDGGSNGWDRKAYFDKYEHLDTDLISNQIKFVSFEKLFVKLLKFTISDGISPAS